MGLPRFRGEVRSWDQGTWFDCIVSSSLGQSFGSSESIFSSRPARFQGRRVERLSMMAGTLAMSPRYVGQKPCSFRGSWAGDEDSAGGACPAVRRRLRPEAVAVREVDV